MTEKYKTGIKNLFTLPPLPETARGYGCIVNANPKADEYAYCNEKNVVIRSFTNPALARVFTHHKIKANVAAFSPNGEWVASGDASGCVVVWGAKNFSIKNEVRVCSSVKDIVWSADGKRIAAVGDGAAAKGRVFAWDGGTPLGEIANHSNSALSVAFKPTRPFRVVTTGEDLSVNFYEGPPFKFKRSHGDHTRYPNLVRFHPNGDEFMTVGSDSKIIFFDGKTGEKTREYTGHKGAIYSFTFSPDGSKFATVSSDKTCKVWDTAKGEVVHTFTIGGPKSDFTEQQVGVVWSKASEEFLVTVSLSGTINYLDPVCGSDTPTKRITGHVSPISAMSLDEEGKLLYTADSAGVVCVNDVNTGESTIFDANGLKAMPVVGIAALPGGTVATADFGNVVRLSTGSEKKLGLKTYDLKSQPSALAAANSTKDMVAVAEKSSGIVKVLQGGEVIVETTVKGSVTCLAFNPDDSQLAVGTKESLVTVHSINEGLRQTAVFKGHDRVVTAVAFQPQDNGKMVVSADDDRKIHVWDQTADEPKGLNMAGWKFHSSGITDLSISPDGTRLLTSSLDRSFFVFGDLVKRSRHNKQQWEDAHKGSVNLCTWIDDVTIATVGQDRCLKIWSVPKLS